MTEPRNMILKKQIERGPMTQNKAMNRKDTWKIYFEIPLVMKLRPTEKEQTLSGNISKAKMSSNQPP